MCEKDKIEKLDLSIGVASVVPKFESQSNDLLQLAGEALYSAKNLGRNRREVSSKRSEMEASRPIQGQAA